MSKEPWFSFQNGILRKRCAFPCSPKKSALTKVAESGLSQRQLARKNEGYCFLFYFSGTVVCCHGREE